MIRIQYYFILKIICLSCKNKIISLSPNNIKLDLIKCNKCKSEKQLIYISKKGCFYLKENEKSVFED